MSCLNFGSRKYVSKDNVSGLNKTGFNSTNPDYGPNYNAVPQMTVTYMHPPWGANGDYSGWTASESESGLCGAESTDYPGTTFLGCGDCSGGTGWKYCSCCITQWNLQNKAKCCDPVANDDQNNAMLCDPEWCPFSPACINDSVTATYCQSNLNDNVCKSTCINNMENAPTWCTNFVQSYCQSKSANGQQLSPQDQILCACSMHKTSADECLLDSCVNASTGATWLTSVQKRNQTDATYCFQQCKNIAQAVANETAPINSIEFQKVCSEVTLPPSTVPPDQLPSNKQNSSGWDFSWNGIQTFFASISTVEWIVFGVILFFILLAFSIKRLMKYTGDSISSTTDQ
jgi:hypothetical protein